MRVLQLDPCGSDALALAEWPSEYVCGRFGRYAHIPRSASQRGVAGLPGFRRSVITWCGVLFHQVVALDEPGELPVCGTCFGRYEAQETDDLAFAPSRAVNAWRPNRRWCPRMTVYETYNRGWCLLCGFEGPIRARSGPYAWGSTIVKHEPASPRPLVYCPQHGINHLMHDEREVRCRFWRCTFRRPIPSREGVLT